MILSDRETQAARARGAIRITPEPMAAAWSSTAVDLTLDGPLSCWEIPKDQESSLPFAFLLGWTVERIQLPHTARLGARVEGKISLARLGLGVHVTAPTIHAGFGASEDPQHLGSSIRLEIWNIGPFRIKLEKGMPICQLIFEWVDGTPEQGYRGQFTVQGPEVLPAPPVTPAPAGRRRRPR